MIVIVLLIYMYYVHYTSDITINISDISIVIS